MTLTKGIKCCIILKRKRGFVVVISSKTQDEIKNIILAEQLMPSAHVNLASLLETNEMGLYKNMVAKEILKFVVENPSYQNDITLADGSMYLQIELVKVVKDILLRYIKDSDYEGVISLLEARNVVPHALNNEIQQFKTKSNRELKQELLRVQNWKDDCDENMDYEMQEKAVSIVTCVIKSVLYSRSLRGKIESWVVKRFKELSTQNIEKEIFV